MTEGILRVSRTQTKLNTESILESAAFLFRLNGVKTVSLRDVGIAAGLTHGAVYARYPAKDALVADAITHAAARFNASISRCDVGTRSTDEIILDYLSLRHRDDRGNGCVLAALSSEVDDQDHEVSSRIAEAFIHLSLLMDRQVPDGPSQANPIPASMFRVTALVGAILLSRATKSAEPALSEAILACTLDAILERTSQPEEPKLSI